jgi:hypothetical protein
MTDARTLVAISRAITATLTAAIEAGAPIREAVHGAVLAHLGGAVRVEVAPDRPSDRYARENAMALQIMADHDAAGRSRHGAASAAKRLAIDPHDPAELERLMQRFRRLKRDAKKNERCAVASAETE